MSTEEIRARAFLIHFVDAPLCLVPDGPGSSAAPERADTGDTAPSLSLPLAYEGANRRGIVVVTDRLHDEDRALLLRILQSVHVTADDVALFVQSEFDVLAHRQALTFEHLIVFGARLVSPLTDTLYQPVETEKIRVLRAHALSHLTVHTADKRALWNALQSFFI